MKLNRLLLFSLLFHGITAYAEPNKCPSVRAMRLQGIEYVYKDKFDDEWIAVARGYFDTPYFWELHINVGKKNYDADEAKRRGKKTLDCLEGGVPLQGPAAYTCRYTTYKPEYTAVAYSWSFN